MDILQNNTEIGNQIRFAHLLSLVKQNKERGYVPRNGKMISFEERNGKSGYSSRLAINVRKFLEGTLKIDDENHQFEITKERDIDSYRINLKNYVYGTVGLIDNMILHYLLAARLNQAQHGNFYVHKNHLITTVQHIQLKSLVFDYHFDLFKDQQELIPAFFDRATAETSDLVETKLMTNGLSILRNSINTIHSLGRVKKMFAIETANTAETLKRAANPSTGATITRSGPVDTRISRLLQKYNITKDQFDSFIKTYSDIKRYSSGLERAMLFNAAKAHCAIDLSEALGFQADDFAEFLPR